MDKFENVTLYPIVWMDVLEELFDRCDYYFDINYGKEIISAVRQAFLHNHLIFAFHETVHNREYIAEEHIYPATDADRMISDIRAIMQDKNLLDEHIQMQHRAAMAEDKEAYRKLFI